MHGSTFPGFIVLASRRYAQRLVSGFAAFMLLLTSASSVIADTPIWGGTSFDEDLQGQQEEVESSWSIPIPPLCVWRTPDLIVASLPEPVWDATNRLSIIDVVIRNQGTGATPANVNFLVRLDADGRAYQVFTSPLAAGASRTVRFTLDYWIYNPDAGYRVTVDPTGVVPECNESNNYADFFRIG